MALFPDPFDALSSLQQALDTFRMLISAEN
jgi:hypothetical protein